jgi:hypothetical protein
MIITPDLEYPIVCINVRRAYDGRSLKLDMINLNSSASWFHSDELDMADMDGTATVVPRTELMNVQAVTQLEKDTILVCYDSESALYSCSIHLDVAHLLAPHAGFGTSGALHPPLPKELSGFTTVTNVSIQCIIG